MIHYANQPSCESCGRPMTTVGRLPPIGGRPGVNVFKCAPCGQVASNERPMPPRATRRPVTNGFPDLPDGQVAAARRKH